MRLMNNWMNDDPWAMGVLEPLSPAPVHSVDWSSSGMALTNKPLLAANLHERLALGQTANHPSKCPLWVMSRHRVTSASCPLLPSKRTFISAVCTSASARSGHRPHRIAWTLIYNMR